jgi:hypothetical protein
MTLTEISQLQKNEPQGLRSTVDGRLAAIQLENDKKLEQMRQTVDEKLQGTLETTLGESFKQVSDRLEQVYKGLGEMQTQMSSEPSSCAFRFRITGSATPLFGLLDDENMRRSPVCTSASQSVLTRTPAEYKLAGVGVWRSVRGSIQMSVCGLSGMCLRLPRLLRRRVAAPLLSALLRRRFTQHCSEFSDVLSKTTQHLALVRTLTLCYVEGLDLEQRWQHSVLLTFR